MKIEEHNQLHMVKEIDGKNYIYMKNKWMEVKFEEISLSEEKMVALSIMKVGDFVTMQSYNLASSVGVIVDFIEGNKNSTAISIDVNVKILSCPMDEKKIGSIACVPIVWLRKIDDEEKKYLESFKCVPLQTEKLSYRKNLMIVLAGDRPIGIYNNLNSPEYFPMDDLVVLFKELQEKGFVN